jgi:hypothetical protein
MLNLWSSKNMPRIPLAFRQPRVLRQPGQLAKKNYRSRVVLAQRPTFGQPRVRSQARWSRPGTSQPTFLSRVAHKFGTSVLDKLIDRSAENVARILHLWMVAGLLGSLAWMFEWLTGGWEWDKWFKKIKTSFNKKD